MALSERTVIGSREVLNDGSIQVRRDTIIERDGVEISRTYHRHVVAPGDNVDKEDPSVQRIAKVEHTQARITAYKLATQPIQ
jgi:hypothetical protein